MSDTTQASATQTVTRALAQSQTMAGAEAADGCRACLHQLGTNHTPDRT